jgi:hypothetical protein
MLNRAFCEGERPAAGAPFSLTECADANMHARRATSRDHFPYIIFHFSFFIAQRFEEELLPAFTMTNGKSEMAYGK